MIFEQGQGDEEAGGPKVSLEGAHKSRAVRARRESRKPTFQNSEQGSRAQVQVAGAGARPERHRP